MGLGGGAAGLQFRQIMLCGARGFLVLRIGGVLAAGIRASAFEVGFS